MLPRSPIHELGSQNMETTLQACSGYHLPQHASSQLHALSFMDREPYPHSKLPTTEPYRQSNESGDFATQCLDFDHAQFRDCAEAFSPVKTSHGLLQALTSHPSCGSPARGQQTLFETEEEGINQSQFRSTDEKNESLRAIETFAHLHPESLRGNPDDFEFDEDGSPPGSEIDENTPDGDDQSNAAERQAEKRKAKRFRLTHTQTRFLQNEFNRQPHPDAAHRLRLSKVIPGLSPRQVQVWFQNRRAKLKRLPIDDSERILRSRALPKYFDYTSAPLVRPYGIAVAQQSVYPSMKTGPSIYPYVFGHGNEDSPPQRIESTFSGFELPLRSGLGLISSTPLYSSQSCVSGLFKSQNVQAGPSTPFSRFSSASNTYQTPPCSPTIRSDTQAKDSEESASPSLRLSETEDLVNRVSRLQSCLQTSSSPLSTSKKVTERSRCYPSLTPQRKEKADDYSVLQRHSTLGANFSDLDFSLEQDQTQDASLLLPEKCGLETENPYLSPAFSSSSYVDHSPQNPQFYSQVVTQDDFSLYSAPCSLGLQLQISDNPGCIYDQQPRTRSQGR